MRDIYLFTKNPMIYEKCEETIFENVKKAGTNKKNAFWSLSKMFWEFEITNETLFEDTNDPDYIEELIGWAKNIPIEEPFINYVGVHRSIDAKRIIKALLSAHPDLYVNVDDGTDWFGTAQEYLDTEFDY